MELQETYDVDYNSSGITERLKWAFLASGPYSLQLTANNVSYTVTIKYNYGSMQPFVSVSNDTGTIQGETMMNDFPTNLLTASELRSYALYWQPHLKRFELYKRTDESWYNSATLTEEEAYKIITKKSFS